MRVPNRQFWQNKKVLVTGHTGFKGSWLTHWLSEMGSRVAGVSLPPPTQPSLYEALGLDQFCESHICDIRNLNGLKKIIQEFEPEILFHLAAQPLVRYSYESPLETYEVNVLGTAHVLEACRNQPSLKSIVIVTTDKCYENREWVWGYRETDPMGGYDPYSSSKGCAELLVGSYRRSFFGEKKPDVGLATARAGNVVGGGDWALDRIVPDAIRSFGMLEALRIRNPSAVRPWQHVLEPLNGYLCLAESAYLRPDRFSEGFNFGPSDEGCVPVEKIISLTQKYWGSHTRVVVDKGPHPHEAHFLKLDTSKARHLLGWEPIWNVEKTMAMTVEWYKCYLEGQKNQENLRSVTSSQISQFEGNLV